jgi:Tfp pilus assembly protein PilX
MKTRLRREDGVALMMALMVMMTLSIVTVTAVAFTSSTTRHANRSKSDQQAYALAEAGLNNALSQLASHYPNTTTQYDSSWVSGSTGVALAGGTSTWSGSFASNKWTLTGTGTIKNPDSGVTRTKTLTTTVDVSSSTGLTGAYAYGFFMGDPNSCTTFENGAVIKTSIYISGCLNLLGTGKIVEPDLTKHTLSIHVGKDLTLANSSTTVGTFSGASPTWAIALANIVGSNSLLQPCVYALVRQACTTAAYVNAQSVTRVSSSVPMPSYNIDTVYSMANGKWKDAVCSTGTQPFETDYTRNGSAGSVRLIRWNNAGAGSAMSSFDCTVYSNGNTGTYVGRLKWTKGTAQTDSSLYIDGTVFLDGSFDALNIDGGSYTGNGTLYVDGKVHFDNASALCGPVSSGSAVLGSSGGCNSAWDPSLGSMLIVSCNAISGLASQACNSAASWSMQMSGNNIIHYTGGSLVSGEYYVTNSGTVVGPVWANYADLTGAAQITPFTSLPSGAPSSGSTGYSIGAPYNYH